MTITSGTVHNFVGVHPTPKNEDNPATEEVSAQMVEEFAHFHSKIVRLLRYELSHEVSSVMSHE